MKSVARLAFLAAAGLCASSAVAQADTFIFDSCHITGSACEGGTNPAGFGTVTLTQSGTSVNVDVVLTGGNVFVETGAGADELFLFNALAGMGVTSLKATLNGADVTSTIGGLTYVFHAPPGVHADGTGFFTGSVECTVGANCQGGQGFDFNDLHFTVTNATLAQLETANAAGNLFAADIFCGATQPGCTFGLTGPVDVSVPVPGPVVGAGLPGLALACSGLIALARRRRQKIV
jgi:hypothetical protein